MSIEGAGPAAGVAKTRLENGLVIVSERMASARSVSFGVFLRTGSRQETEERHGLTHFIEHAVFKGTGRRTAVEIAEEADLLGGNLDAFTGREVVGFSDKVLDYHFARSFGLIADLVTDPVFDRAELEKERTVILEELKMVEDTPDDIIFDIFSESIYPAHPLGRPIIGTRESLLTFTPEMVRPYFGEIFSPANMVIAGAGNLRHEELVALARERFGGLAEVKIPECEPAPRSKASIELRDREDLEQSHVVIGMPCVSAVSHDRYVCNLLSVILGGGMSSRLFQSVREERGLVYTVYSAINPFRDCGNLNIYAAASPERLEETIESILAEVRRMRFERVGEAELRRNKEQLKSSLILNLESTSSRMSSLAQQEMTFGRFFTPEEILEGVEAVTAEEIGRMAAEIFDPEQVSVTILGDLDGFSLKRADLDLLDRE